MIILLHLATVSQNNALAITEAKELKAKTPLRPLKPV